MSSIRRFFGPLAILTVAHLAVAYGAETQRTRTFRFDYRCVIETVPEGTERLLVWIPIPPPTEDQEVGDFKIHGLAVYGVKTEPEYRNRYLFTELLDPNPAGFSIGYSCTVTRREILGPEKDDPPQALLDRLLAPDRLVPVAGRPAEIAERASAGRKEPGEKARAFYDWVLEEMTYDKSGTGWGKGDFFRACSVKTGNCSDFHSYFIGLARASMIPAVFEIGFPLPPDQNEGAIAGYHCWAKFYTGGDWVSVDISEADQRPEMKEYYFGNLTPDRVMLSRGRDITLVPPQAGEPLNFFVYPYVEADGKPLETVGWKVSFKDLP